MTAGEVAARLNGRQSGAGWMARCPAHDDGHASLSIDEGADGRVLLHCHCGCGLEAILARAGLTTEDLFPRGEAVSIPPRNTATLQHPGCTLEAYAAAKGLPIAKLKTFGLSDFTYGRGPAVRIPYRGVDGRDDGPVRFRVALDKGPDGDQRFQWKKGSKLSLYGLDHLADARALKAIVMVEGESDCQTLWCKGIPAIGLPGAASYKEEWSPHLAGIETIYIVIEPDAGGDAVLKWLAKASIRDRVRLVRLTGHKDVSQLHLADPDRFMTRWQAAVDAAEPWTVYAARHLQVQAAEAWSQCATLAGKSDILQELDRSLDGRGVVGEHRVGRLVYLTATSRVFPRPVSIAIKGPSSGGKSHIVQQVLDHCPPEAYYALSAMSERALAYSEEPLKHRMLVIYEAAGMSGDFATYLVRSLLSEGCVRYETVEKTKDGLHAKLIEREGPTGLITTTTAVHLHPENETRLLSIPVTDTPDQTRQILTALSEDRRAVAGDDLIPWKALQTWLATSEPRVVIPYARWLAERIRPVAIRLRRDFTTLLTLIKSHAFLHQRTRTRDDDGRIVATLADYAAVRELVSDLFDMAVQTTVSSTVRETVQAVRALTPSNEPASLANVSKYLKLDKGTVSRRVKAALAEGYLNNLESKRNQPMKLVAGDPLPDAAPLLPEPASLDPSCSGAVLFEGIETPLPPSAVPLPEERERVRL